MQKLRLAIIGTLLHFTVFFNLERIDIGGENALDIQTFVYIIAFIAAFSVMIFPNLWRPNVVFGYILWLGIYLVIKYWFNPNERAIFGDINTYITITEIAMLTLTIMLTHNLAVHLYDAEETIKRILMVGFSRRIKSLEEAKEEIDLELYRSRRNQQPLSVVVLEVADEDANVILNQTVEEIIKSTRKHYIYMSLARVVRRALRRTDMLLHQTSSGRLILIGPETSAKDATHLIEKIKMVAKNELNISPNLGVATFPEDALTFNDLVDQAEWNLISKRSRN